MWEAEYGHRCPTVQILRADGQFDRKKSSYDPWGVEYQIVCDDDIIVAGSAGSIGLGAPAMTSFADVETHRRTRHLALLQASGSARRCRPPRATTRHRRRWRTRRGGLREVCDPRRASGC